MTVTNFPDVSGNRDPGTAAALRFSDRCGMGGKAVPDSNTILKTKIKLFPGKQGGYNSGHRAVSARAEAPFICESGPFIAICG